MKVDRYSVRIFWSDEDDGYIAVSPELGGVSAFGETPESALAELGTARGLWMEEMHAMGRDAPPPLTLPRHSGQFRLRVPRSLHAWLAARAELEGLSLNTLIVQLLSEARGAQVSTASDSAVRRARGGELKSTA
jgi:predicted RNase H-like HicB family nuclease